MSFLAILSIFVLACFVGYYVVWPVTPALNTPLDADTMDISAARVLSTVLPAHILAASSAAIQSR